MVDFLKASLATTALLLAITSGTARGDDINSPKLNLTCLAGPAEHKFAEQEWMLYACSDGHSVVAVSGPQSPSNPFLFIFGWSEGKYTLHGEGTGSKAATDAVYDELSKYSQSQIEELYASIKK